MVNNATEAHPPHVCRTVETNDIDPKFLPLIRKMFADRTDAMLSGIHEALKSSRWRRSGQPGQRVRIGMAVFSHEEDREEHTPNETAKRVNASTKKRSKPVRLTSRKQAS
jgi:hypothetical protein